MTRREYKALLELKRWIVAAIPNHKEAVRLIEALEPLGRGIHPGDKGEVSALRLDEINETEEALRERLKNMLNVSASPTAGRYRAKGAIHNNFEKILSGAARAHKNAGPAQLLRIPRRTYCGRRCRKADRRCLRRRGA